MQFKSWNSYQTFSDAIAKESRYIFSEETEAFLEALLHTREDRVRILEKGTILWRAQLGHDWRPEYAGEELMDYFPKAFSPERMKPLKDSASEGRANPKGIPYLYLASDRDTALSEVRPWIGSIISAGQFKTVEELKLIDFSVEHGKKMYYFFDEPTEKEKIQAVWSHIDNAFSRPVTESDSTSDYAPTQVIAEFIKSKGYDGIVYKSSLSNGYNIALFDMNSAVIVNCAMHEAKSLLFKFEQVDEIYL
jgi:RES domain-containing protein